MGLLDFLRRRRPADRAGAGGSTIADSPVTTGAVGAAGLAPDGDVPPAGDHGDSATGGDRGAAGYDSGGGFEGWQASGCSWPAPARRSRERPARHTP